MNKYAFSRPRINGLAGYCLLAFMAIGLASNIYALIVDKQPLTKDPITTPAFLDGRVTKQIAERMADTFLPSTSAQGERGVSWLAFGDLGPRVREGCKGWLFLTDELTSYKDAQANALARAATVTRVAARLKSQGIELLVAVIPDKSRIEHDKLCGLTRPAEFSDRTSTWISALQKSGVQTIDLAIPMSNLQGEPFLRTDTHWSEVGANAAATAIAARIQDEHTKDGLLGTPQNYKYVAGTPKPRPGDLTRLAGIDWLPLVWQPAQDIVAESSFEIAVGTTATATTEEDALFGDDNLPKVTVVGTSFSRNSNFVPFLEYRLGVKVANFGRDGGEFAGGAHAYFNSPAFKQTPPKLIIWEIPERSLQRPLAGDEQLN